MTTETLQCTVVALQGYPIANVAPTAGQALVYNGSAWVPDAVTFRQADSALARPDDVVTKAYVDGLVEQLQARITALEAKT